MYKKIIKQLFPILTIILITSCNGKKTGNNDAPGKAETDQNTSKNNSKKVSGRNVGEGLKGDFDGDGNIETAQLRLLKEGNFEESPFKFSIDFTNPKIPSFTFDSNHEEGAYLINEGELVNNAGDEISFFSPPLEGTLGWIQVLTLKNYSWKDLVSAPYQTPNDFKSAEEIIFRENGVLYYWDAMEAMNKNAGAPPFVKVKVKLK